MAITHNAVVVVPDDGTSPVGSDEWNAAHTIEAGTVGKTELDAIALAFLCPTGAEMMWPVATPPTGWLIEDGSSQLIASYPCLSALIRSTYGGADGTHFYLPDMRGVVPVGVGGVFTLNLAGGEMTHTLTAAESGVPAHVHPIAGVRTNEPMVAGTDFPPGGNGGGTLVSFNSQANAAATASSAHNTLQPYRVRNFVIKT